MLACILLVFLTGGLAELVRFRLEKGDAYPEYSSYRKDGLGAGVLYESLRLLPQLEVERHLKTSMSVSDPQKSILFWLGSDRSFEFETETSRFVEQGGHLVLSLGMNRPLSRSMQSEDAREKKAQRTRRLLDVRYDHLAVPEHNRYSMLPVSDEGLQELTGFGRGGFVDLSPEWLVLYKAYGVATVIQRPYGEGTVTLFANSYPFSNESLLREAPIHFFQWLLEGREHILFDETHLGIVSSPGMVGLLKRYHLGPLYVSLIVLGLLSVWRASASLLPKSNQPPVLRSAKSMTGKTRSMESQSGVIGLIRRHVRRSDLFSLCVDRWVATAPLLSQRQRQFQDEIEALGKQDAKTDAQLLALYRQATDKLRAKH